MAGYLVEISSDTWPGESLLPVEQFRVNAQGARSNIYSARDQRLSLNLAIPLIFFLSFCSAIVPCVLKRNSLSMLVWCVVIRRCGIQRTGLLGRK